MSVLMDSRTVTARKWHWCDDCAREIGAGERYHRSKTVNENGWRTFNNCEQCRMLSLDLWEEEVRDEDEDGRDCYPYLREVDWPDVRLWSPLWALRADRYLEMWTDVDGESLDYPIDPREATS